MPSNSRSIYAAVMGDLVSSERLRLVEETHAHFNEVIHSCNRIYRESLSSPLTITLGDEFQGLVTSLSAATPIVRDLRFKLLEKEVDCRFALGVAHLRTPLNAKKAWNMMGQGLSKTRAKLNEKRDLSLYRFAIADDPVMETALEALGSGLTSIERRWTHQQRKDIVALLSGATASDLAKRRNVSAHSVYKVRASGDFDTYSMLWSAIEEALAQIDKLNGMT